MTAGLRMQAEGNKPYGSATQLRWRLHVGRAMHDEIIARFTEVHRRRPSRTIIITIDDDLALQPAHRKIQHGIDSVHAATDDDVRRQHVRKMPLGTVDAPVDLHLPMHGARIEITEQPGPSGRAEIQIEIRISGHGYGVESETRTYGHGVFIHPDECGRHRADHTLVGQ